MASSVFYGKWTGYGRLREIFRFGGFALSNINTPKKKELTVMYGRFETKLIIKKPSLQNSSSLLNKTNEIGQTEFYAHTPLAT